ncbi:uncharacterized protein METZ01_LOCUS233376, partial [marine metagenome]
PALGFGHFRRPVPDHIAGRTGLLSGPRGPSGLHRQHPRILLRRTLRHRDAGPQLPLVGRHPHLRHGLGGDGVEAGGGDTTRIPPSLLGHRHRHRRHHGRFSVDRHLPRIHPWRHQLGQLAVRPHDDIHRKLDHPQCQQSGSGGAVAPVLRRRRCRPDGAADVCEEPFRWFPDSSHRSRRRLAPPGPIDLAVDLRRLALEGDHSQVRGATALYQAAPLLPGVGPRRLRHRRHLAHHRPLHRHDGQPADQHRL